LTITVFAWAFEIKKHVAFCGPDDHQFPRMLFAHHTSSAPARRTNQLSAAAQN
jgi:hypothetical protein